MTPPETALPPELPPPPLADSDRLAEEALPRFPDTPLPWAVVPAGLVAGVTELGRHVLWQPGAVAAAAVLGRPSPPPLGLAQLLRPVIEAAMLGVAFAWALVVADRLLRRWPRPLRWTIAGAAEGLLYIAVALGPGFVSTVTGSGVAVAARLLLNSAGTIILPATLRGLVHGLFAGWRRHPSLVFGAAGVASVLAAWPVALLATLARSTPGPSAWSALTAWPWWFLPLALVTSMAWAGVYGAIFGYAILWSDDQRVARPRPPSAG